MRHSPEQPPELPHCSPTRRQQAFLARNKLHPDRAIDFYEASHRIGKFIDHRRQLPATAKQEALLRQHGQWREGMTRGEAFDRIRGLMKEGGG